MKASILAVKLIKQVEGLELNPYHDGAGYKTVGWGHLLRKDEPIERITVEQAEAYLASDIADAEDAINRLVQIELTQNQFDALVCFVFNIGEQQFAGSGTLRVLNEGKLDEALVRWAKWNKIRKNGNLVVSPGLNNRRKQEIALWNRAGEL